MDITLNIKINSDTKLLFVSDIHEHSDQFNTIINKFKISDKLKLVVCGDVLDKGYGINEGLAILHKIKDLSDQGNAFFIKGNHELKNIKKYRKNGNMPPILHWVEQQPLSLSFVYPNSSRYTAIHAGVEPKMTWKDLTHNLNLCYIRNLSNETKEKVLLKKQEIDGKTSYISSDGGASVWHKFYDGRFGYIVSGHDNNPKGPMFYNYSCNIDTGVFTSGKLTSVLFGQNGREDVYQAIGRAYNNEQSTT